MPHESSPYDRAPAPERESAWLADAAREYRHAAVLRGLGPDSPHREYALREAALADRTAMTAPSPDAREHAEETAYILWVMDGWDENWEGESRRPYVRWAYERWLAGPAQ